MEKTYRVIIGCFLLSWSVLAFADINKVQIKKIEQDLYQTSDGAYIQTNGCYADANGKDAVLKFVKYGCDNTLRFNDKTICEVVDVWK